MNDSGWYTKGQRLVIPYRSSFVAVTILRHVAGATYLVSIGGRAEVIWIYKKDVHFIEEGTTPDQIKALVHILSTRPEDEHRRKYPNWICHECAINAGGVPPSMATFHDGVCDMCGLTKTVTEPRDYGYPKFL